MEIHSKRNIWTYVAADLSCMLPAGRKVGQWCFKDNEIENIKIWKRICENVRNGLLWKYARLSSNEYEGGKIICVFTYDVRHKADVMRTREVLRRIGVEQPIGYISNENISAGIEQWNYQDDLIHDSTPCQPIPPLWLLREN